MTEIKAILIAFLSKPSRKDVDRGRGEISQICSSRPTIFSHVFSSYANSGSFLLIPEALPYPVILKLLLT